MDQALKVLTEDDFDNNYTMNTKLKSENFDNDGRFETFGNDLEIVKNTNERYVWTCVDGDDGMYFVAGYHLVNRIYYLITNEPWLNQDEEYLIQSYDEDQDEE